MLLREPGRGWAAGAAQRYGWIAARWEGSLGIARSSDFSREAGNLDFLNVKILIFLMLATNLI